MPLVLEKSFTNDFKSCNFSNKYNFFTCLLVVYMIKGNRNKEKAMSIVRKKRRKK